MADNETMFQREAGSRQEAIDLAKNISESGITQNEVHSKYSKWAQNYDKVRIAYDIQFIFCFCIGIIMLRSFLCHLIYLLDELVISLLD